ncbi:MAG: methyltransferase domain-containing protein [Acidimicrobiia bacterium]
MTGAEVAGAGASGIDATRTVVRDGVRRAYGGGAAAWSGAPDAIYRRLADALVLACPVALRTTRVLDFGAGTGAATAALAAAGAHVIAADLSPAMLAVRRSERPPAVAADLCALPFRRASFDVAAGAFVLSHLPDPARGLVEVAGVTRRGGWVLALSFDSRWSYPGKEVVEAVMERFGYRRPAWFEELKTTMEPRVGLPGRLHDLAAEAGLHDVRVVESSIDAGVRRAADIVAWRLASPGCSEFVASLDPATRVWLVDDAADALGPDPEPLVPAVLVVAGRVGF